MRKGVIATIKPKMVVEERRLCEKRSVDALCFHAILLILHTYL